LLQLFDIMKENHQSILNNNRIVSKPQLMEGEYMDGFSEREQILVAALVLVTVIGLGVNFYLRNNVKNIEGFKLERGSVKAVSASFTTSDVEPDVPKKLIVHVSGAVKNPGVYELFEGDRVKDAIDAAGGQADGADLNALNLALKLDDEDKIYVPISGEELVSNGRSLQPDDGKININTADKRQLEGLPGIGEVIAGRIVEYREKNGAFKSPKDIVKVSGIGDVTYDSIKDLIKVK
jgi:competence protein ComEA